MVPEALVDSITERREMATRKTNAAVHDYGTDDCERDVAAAVRHLEGVTVEDIAETAQRRAPTSAVPETHDRSVFEVTGLDCPTCAALVETALVRVDGVSNATASHRQGTVRVDYDDGVAVPDLRERLSTLGYPVESTDQAYAARRAAHWQEARFAGGVLAGLMVLAPYAAVIYPTRFDIPGYDPAVVELLEGALTSVFASHFYLNLAVLTGFVLLFAGKPILDEAKRALVDGTPNRSLAVAGVAVGLYVYSSAAAFPPVFDGGVYYDVVVALVVGTTVLRQSGTDAPETAPDEEPADGAVAEALEDVGE